MKFLISLFVSIFAHFYVLLKTYSFADLDLEFFSISPFSGLSPKQIRFAAKVFFYENEIN